MDTIILPFGTSSINIQSHSQPNLKRQAKIRDEVVEIIDIHFSKLLSSSPSSELVRFHETQIGTPCQISTIFLHFFLTCLQIQTRSENLFTAFFDSNNDPLKDTNENLELDEEKLTITKLAPVTLKPSTILSPLIIEQIGQNLRSHLPDFLISTRDIFVAHGKYQQEIHFHHPITEQPIEMDLLKQSVVMTTQKITTRRTEPNTDTPNPFSTAGLANGVIAVIVEANDPVIAKAVGEMTFKINQNYKFNELAKMWGCGITLLTEDEKVVQYG